MIEKTSEFYCLKIEQRYVIIVKQYRGFIMTKEDERLRAIRLRKEGKSYSEIRKQIPVAKSTLSLWLRSVGLAKTQKQRLTEKKIEAALRGADIRRQQRLHAIQNIEKETKKDITDLTQEDLFLCGVMLYWAEGSKEKDITKNSVVKFSNSDPKMIRLFLKWLEEIAQVKHTDIVYELYIHETAGVGNALSYWAKTISCNKEEIRVYFKRNHITTNRKNIEKDYHGLIRIVIRKSSVLMRKIHGWTNAICQYWGIV